MTSPRVLILFAHPALEKSRVNRVLADAVRDLPGVTFRDLYQHYPDLDIDVEVEQELLGAHEIVVFQHPLYWYSTPAIIKEWFDLVLQHGWAYGSDGTALVGKQVLTVTTTGSSEESYQPDGLNLYSLRQLLAPVQRTAEFCGMEYLPPFGIHSSFSLTGEEVAGHAADYRRVIEALRDGRLDRAKAKTLPKINADLDSLLGGRS